MQCEEDRAVMHALHEGHGWSIARIAREFDLNWRTAKRYATSEMAVRYPERERPAKLSEAQLAHLRRRLGVCPELRATTLYREILELGYAGSYPSFARRVRAERPKDELLDPPIRFETDPGVQVQADWSDCRDWLLGERMVKLHALVVILGYSRMPQVRFSTDTTRATTLRLLLECLDSLGGAPGEVLTDRDPAFVIGSTPSGHAVFAPEWIDLAAVLGTTPKACKPYRAKAKGKVERMIREVKQDFLPWLTGQVLPPRPSLHDYDALAERWCTEVVGVRRHRTIGRVVAEAWAAERQLLRPIPPRVLGAMQGRIVVAGAVFDGPLSKRGAESLPEPRSGSGWYDGPGNTDGREASRALRSVGDQVDPPELADYEAVLA